jgi:hypothetical protein
MKWFSSNSLKALVNCVLGKINENMQAVQNTFNEVYENLEDLDERIESLNQDSITEDIFNRYYGLASSKTEILADGSVKTTNSEAVITTKFGTDSNGRDTVTETIKPTTGGKVYTKVTTIASSAGTTTITEQYTESET